MRYRNLLGGGTAGNEQLTAMTGVVLLGLLAVVGITILRIRQLISVHLFVGLLVMGPVMLKMASTGYRFARYYTRDQLYRAKGPPDLAMRLIAPGVVVSTVVVFVSGLLLLFAGPQGRDQYLALHKVSFIVWLVFTSVHVLCHLPGLSRSLRAPGDRAGRTIALAGAVVGGLVLALVLIPQYAAWANHFPRHFHAH